MSAQVWRMMDAIFDMSRPAGCAVCGEADEFSPNVEAFEVSGKLVCDECAEEIIDAHDNSPA